MRILTWRRDLEWIDPQLASFSCRSTKADCGAGRRGRLSAGSWPRMGSIVFGVCLFYRGGDGILLCSVCDVQVSSVAAESSDFPFQYKNVRRFLSLNQHFCVRNCVMFVCWIISQLACVGMLLVVNSHFLVFLSSLLQFGHWKKSGEKSYPWKKKKKQGSLFRSCLVYFQPVSNADFIVPVEIDGTIHQVSFNASQEKEQIVLLLRKSRWLQVFYRNE